VTFKEFMKKMLSTFPLAQVGEDNDGQLVIYTGLKAKAIGDEVFAVEEESYTEAEVNALVVSAYKAARDESCISAETAEGTPCTCDAELPSHSFYCGRQPWNRIRALTLASAKAVLDEMLCSR
jgi:hypothetical protein